MLRRVDRLRNDKQCVQICLRTEYKNGCDRQSDIQHMDWRTVVTVSTHQLCVETRLCSVLRFPTCELVTNKALSQKTGYILGTPDVATNNCHNTNTMHLLYNTTAMYPGIAKTKLL